MNGPSAKFAIALFSGLLLSLSGCGGKNDTAPGGKGAPGSTNPANPANPGNPGDPGNPGNPGNPTGPGGGADTDTSPQGPGPGAAEIPNNPACQNLNPVGHFVGDIAPTASLVDNLGRSVNLHNFCDSTLLILAGASTCPTCNARARLAARLMRDRFNDGRVKLLYLLSVEGSDEDDPSKWTPAQLEHAKAFHAKHQFGPNALTLVDGNREGTRTLWPNAKLPMNSMVLRPGFRIVTKGPGMPDFETDVMNALAMPRDPQPQPKKPENPGNPTGNPTGTPTGATTAP